MQPQTLDILQAMGGIAGHRKQIRPTLHVLSSETIRTQSRNNRSHSAMFFSRSFAVFAVLTLLIGATARAADRPNILYIMSDDHAAHAISAYRGRLA
jgi:hypothetical protein